MATWPTITDDDGSNTTGTVVNNTNVWTPVQSYIGGTWATQAFNAAHYTASGSMTWTVASGDVLVNRYTQIVNAVIWNLQVQTTTVGGTPSTELRVTLPGGLTAGSSHRSLVHAALVTDNGTVREAYVQIAASGTYATISRSDGQNWTASTDLTGVAFQIVFEV